MIGRRHRSIDPIIDHRSSPMISHQSSISRSSSCSVADYRRCTIIMDRYFIDNRPSTTIDHRSSVTRNHHRSLVIGHHHRTVDRWSSIIGHQAMSTIDHIHSTSTTDIRGPITLIHRPTNDHRSSMVVVIDHQSSPSSSSEATCVIACLLGTWDNPTWRAVVCA